MTEFQGKTVLITGGGSGIGFATARLLVDAGANVVLAGRRIEKLDIAAKELDPSGERVLAVGTDVSRLDDIDELVTTIRDTFGRLDGIFVNAGVAFSAPSIYVDEAIFDQVTTTNVKGAFFTILKAVDLFDDKGGAIVVNGTCLTHRANGVSSLYAATKAAVTSLARSFAAEFIGKGIRVNSVSPGFIQTDLLEGVIPNEEVRDMVKAQIPMARIGEADEVAGAVVFLLSPRASYITGQDLGVDGGVVTVAQMG